VSKSGLKCIKEERLLTSGRGGRGGGGRERRRGVRLKRPLNKRETGAREAIEKIDFGVKKLHTALLYNRQS